MLRQTRPKPVARTILRSAVLIPLLLAACSHGPRPLSSDAIANIDSAYASLAEQRLWSGYVLVAQGDEVLLSKGYGMADLEAGTPITSSTRFDLASLVLPFEATAVMILQDEGKLNIDDPICEYLPPCEPAIQPILIRHLLNLSSGLQMDSYVPGDGGRWIDPSGAITHEPGQQFDGAFAEGQYQYVWPIIERASGESLEAFVREAILEPLKMSNTGFVNGNSGLATDYVAYASRAAADHADELKGVFGGLIYSSADDLFLWMRALHSGQILSQSALDEMFAPGIPAEGAPAYFAHALGWWQENKAGHTASAHGGLIDGFLCNVEYFENDDATVIVLSNLWNDISDIQLASDLLFAAP